MTEHFAQTHRPFQDWSVVISGGSKGIGKAVALNFADLGARVAVCARGESALQELRNVMDAREYVGFVDSCDVTDGKAVDAFIASAAGALGGVDVLVNCASAFAVSDDESGWSQALEVDLMGTVRMTWAAVPFLQRSTKPSIVNVSSIAALQATSTRIPYGAAKAAVIHQTASNAKTLAKDGIRVNCVLPGSTEFPGSIWSRIAETNPERYEMTRNQIPLQRFATVEDIAKVILFLSSSDAAWITGQSITVDGGQTLFGS